MNWDQIQGQWKQLAGRAQTEWGELTNDDVDQVAGDRLRLEGKIQERYGKNKEEAREAVDAWIARL
ncbi:CsbD family protein [Acuticoccus sp. I52.16.1]|uniref:CsbD family protein n=1 Tax=Acuticoccus sp. I52.16.1 TaxID=2928472 RepID=UPI001FD49723|nr:CsbD family protein [Acuticoccus sp. I52.16.1]UOM34494.1 CsbD family protein [Acuticoccus sp. I52.16.1]